LAEELWMTEVELEAVLDTQTMRLGEVFGWTAGSHIDLGATPDSQVTLFCGDVPMYLGRMGRKADQIAIRIHGRYEKPKE